MPLENVSDIFPLTQIQQGILFHCIAQPNEALYINQVVADLHGELDVAILQRAWSVLIDHHAMLRTEFLWDGLDQPLQVVRETVSPKWRHLNWLQQSDDEKQARLEQLIIENQSNQTTPINYSTAPLLHLSICRWSDQHWKLVVCFHHLILDGWSMHSLLADVQYVYRQLLLNQTLKLQAPFPFKNYIQWQTEQGHATAFQHWSKILGGFESRNRVVPYFRDIGTIPPEKKPEQQSHPQSTLTFDSDRSAAFADFARRNRLTMNTVILGAWAILTGRYSNQSDVVFGTTLSGRTHELSGIEQAVGMFINTLPIRADADSEVSLIEWLQQIQRDQSEANRLSFSSLAEVQKAADLPPGEELFESIVVFENYPADPKAKTRDDEQVTSQSISISNIEHHERSNYPIALIVVPEPTIQLLLIYDSRKVTTIFADQILKHVSAVIEKITTGEASCPRDISPFVDGEIKGFLDRADHKLQIPQVAGVHELIERGQEEYSDRTAVVFQDSSLSYDELNRHADQVATQLVKAGAGPNDRVGLFVNPSLELVVGILGILKSGAAYVPFDPEYPAEHQSFIVSDAEIKVVLTTADLLPSLEPIASKHDCNLIKINLSQVPTSEGNPWKSTVKGDDLAYVIYTSGSSGRPKGVMVTHSNLLHSTVARHTYYEQPVESFLLQSSFAFDSSVAGIFWTLTTGGKLVLIATGLKQDIHGLSDLIEQQSVTHTLCLPSLYRLLLSGSDAKKLSSLQVVVVAGEACSADLVERHFAIAKGTCLFNEYGPTESTVWSSVHRFNKGDIGKPVSIGSPIPGQKIVILDQRNRPLPQNVLGELCIVGSVVAKGYLNLPDLTAQRFVTAKLGGESVRVYKTGDLACCDEQGQLHFAGRVDGQIKVRGHRIETEGIAQAIKQLPNINEVAVRIWERNSGGSAQIAAYFSTTEPDSANIQMTVRKHLENLLPKFMLPDHLQTVEQFPRLPNGKVDIRRLPQITVGSVATSDEPTSKMQQTMVEIWKQSIGCPHIGINDNFFSLGGDSIISIQVVSRSRQAGIFFEPGQLARHPTVKKLCDVAEWQNASNDETQSDEQENVFFPMSPIQNWFFEQNFSHPQHWNQSQMFRVADDVTVDAIRSVIQETVARHPMLRARFLRTEDSWQQVIVPVAENQVPFRSINSSTKHLEDELLRTQSEFDLENGSLIQALHIHLPADGQKLLLLAVHHLIIDSVSWKILIAELNDRLQAIRESATPILAEPTTSFMQHVLDLQSPELQEKHAVDVDYWSKIQSADVKALMPGVDIRSQANEKNTFTESQSLDQNLTKSLLTRANEAFNTQPLDLILTAFALTISKWNGQNQCLTELEFHGRAAGANQADFSNTIGWFTCSVPMLIELSDADGIGDSIKSIKEQLRELREKRLGFGILKHCGLLNKNRKPVQKLQSAPILFNYLGKTIEPAKNNGLLSISGAESTSRHPDNRRTHPLEVVVNVSGSEFSAEWRYSEKLFPAHIASKIADEFSTTLKSVIEFCMNSNTDFTPSDFPDAGMTQDQLDEFLSDFE